MIHKKLNIAVISQPWNRADPPVESGSVAIWNYEVARRLSQSCNVVIYAKNAEAKKRKEDSEGVQYQYISTSLDRLLLRLLAVWSRFRRSTRPDFCSWLYCIEYILKVSLDLRHRKCDIVHIQNTSQFVSIVRALNPGIRIVLHMHCEWLTQLDRKVISRRLKKTDVVVGCSEYITEKVRRRFPLYASRCRTIYNGADVHHTAVRRGGENGRPKQILFVGRISPEKGLHVLLEAFERVLQQYSQVELDIVGPKSAPPAAFIFNLSDNPKVSGLVSFCNGDYLACLKKQLAPEVMRRVSFSGVVPHSALTERYHAADIYVQPSLIEAFPLPIVEAMAAGLPVVGTCVGGIPEAIQKGRTGLLVQSDDAEALAKALLRLLLDEDLRGTMGASARVRAVEQFSWEHITKNLLSLYQSMGANA